GALDGQLVPEPDLLDGEVVVHEADLVGEGDERARAGVEGVPEDARQPLDGALGLARLLLDERGDGVERVEEEVRVDLRAERDELRLGALADERLLAFDEREALHGERELAA